MYMIIEWSANPKDAHIVMDDDNTDEAGNAVFNTEAEAGGFAEKNCAFTYRIVKI